MPSMVKQNRMLLKTAKNHLHPGSVLSQWQWTLVLTGQPGWVRSPLRDFIIILSAGQKTKHTCNFWSFLSHHMSGNNISSTSWHALWRWALPLLFITATLHLARPSQTCVCSAHPVLAFPCHHTIPPSPFPCIHSPEKLVLSPKSQGPEEGGLGNWGDLLAALSTAWAAAELMNSTGSSSRKWREAAHRECPHLCVKEGSFTDTTGHVPITAQPWTLIYHSCTSKAIHPAASASPCTEPQQWYLPCYCTGAFSGSISLVFMQSSADRSLSASSKYHYCYCISDGYCADIFQACTINNLQR